MLLVPHLNCNCNPSKQKPPGTVLGPLSCLLPWDPADVSQLDISLCADSYCGYCPSPELKRDAATLHLSLLEPVAGLLSCNDIRGVIFWRLIVFTSCTPGERNSEKESRIQTRGCSWSRSGLGAGEHYGVTTWQKGSGAESSPAARGLPDAEPPGTAPGAQRCRRSSSLLCTAGPEHPRGKSRARASFFQWGTPRGGPSRCCRSAYGRKRGTSSCPHVTKSSAWDS